MFGFVKEGLALGGGELCIAGDWIGCMLEGVSVHVKGHDDLASDGTREPVRCGC